MYFTRGTTKNRMAQYSEAGPDYVENMTRLSKKFDTAKKLVPPAVIKASGKPTRLGVLYYGSTSPAMNEALQAFTASGLEIDAIRVRGFPFGAEVSKFLETHDNVFVVEQNRDAQLKSLLVNELQVDPNRLPSVLHYDGTPITARFIIKDITAQLERLTPSRKVS
jgi:2-oxoglutarate ferredoxin oxidoreductase subunit alpha